MPKIPGTTAVARTAQRSVQRWLGKGSKEILEHAAKEAPDLYKATAQSTLEGFGHAIDSKLLEPNDAIAIFKNGDVENLQNFSAQGTDAMRRSQMAEQLNPSKPVALPESDPQRLAGREWFKQGGGQDVELNKLLTKGRGPNAKLQTLEELIKEAKTSKGAQTRLDRYKSMLATGPAADEADEIVYGIKGKNPDQITRQFEGEPGYNKSFHQGTEFHHKSMKELEGEIGLKAKQLQQSGAATEDDLYDLFELGRSRGLESGSRRGAGIYAQRASHQALHQNIMLPSGIQPSMTRWTNKPLRSRPSEFSKKIWDAAKAIDPKVTRYDLENIKAWSGNRPLEEAIAKWQAFKKSKAYEFLGPDGESEISRMVNEIKAIDNIEDLKKYKTMILDEIAEPMTKEAELLERVVRENMTARELFEVASPKEIADLAQKVKANEARMASDKLDAQIEDAMKTAYDN